MWQATRAPITKSTVVARALGETGFWRVAVAVAVLAAVPLWIVDHPPLEDLPIHAATLRVVHSLHDPRFGLGDFRLTLGRTQYVSYYLLGDALASVVGVLLANLILASATLAGTVLGMRALLRALRRDERLCLLVVPLLYNPLFGLGLFPFLLGIPVFAFASAAAIEHCASPTWRSGAWTSALGVALFTVHIVPFGLFVVAALAWVVGRGRIVARAAPLVAPLGLATWWTFGTDAGRQVLEAARARGPSHRAPFGVALAALPGWTYDLFTDRSDDVRFVLLAALVVVCVGLALRSARADPRAQGAHCAHRAHGAPTTARRWAIVPATCLVLYFVLEPASGFMWPLAQRFALLAALGAVPLVPCPTGRAGRAVTAAALGLALLSIADTARHFRRFAREEVGAFSAALDAIAPRSRVAALIFEPGSRIVNGNPFLHFGSLVQAEKGGVVQFSFAGYNHWPIDFLPGHYPPPGTPARPRWEWSPRDVTAQELAPYYDYVLVRGGPLAPPGCDAASAVVVGDGGDGGHTCRFTRVFGDEHWAVWRRAR